MMIRLTFVSHVTRNVHVAVAAVQPRNVGLIQSAPMVHVAIFAMAIHALHSVHKISTAKEPNVSIVLLCVASIKAALVLPLCSAQAVDG